MRNCLAGPFIGEFGWELFCWQGFLRKRRPDYDSMTVICRKGHRVLYEDFADEVIEIEIPTDSVDGWKNAGFDPHAVTNYYKANRGFTDFIPFDSYKYWWWAKPNAQIKQVFKPYGNCKSGLETDILMHIRCAHHAKSSYRNWAISSAYEYAKWALSNGYKLACIGKSDTSSYIPYDIIDCRDLPLESLVDIMASSRVLIGSQSGPFHLAALCRLQMIAWQQSQESADRLAKHWNPFNVNAWTHPGTGQRKRPRPSFVPSLEWMQRCTLEALNA